MEFWADPGEYEIVLKWDPSNSRDSASAGLSGHQILDGYKLDGTRLWRIDLGRNIRAGAHDTQFMVYDLDGDGRAEVVCKTADGTLDGLGQAVGDAGKDYRSLIVATDGIQVASTADAGLVPCADWGIRQTVRCGSLRDR